MSSISGLSQGEWDAIFSGSVNIPTSITGQQVGQISEWNEADIMTVAGRLFSLAPPTNPEQAAWFNAARAWFNAGLLPLLISAAEAESEVEALNILQQNPRTGPLIAWLTGVAAAGLEDDDDWGTVGQMQMGMLRV